MRRNEIKKKQRREERNEEYQNRDTKETLNFSDEWNNNNIKRQ